MATVAMDLVKIGTELERKGEEGRCGGDGVVQIMSKLVVVMVTAEARRLGLLQAGEVDGDGVLFSGRRRIFSAPRTCLRSMKVLDAELDASASSLTPVKSVLGKVASMAPTEFPRRPL
jgi:hypothetical protein